MTETKSEKKGGGEQTLTVALRIRPQNEDEVLQGSTQIAYKVEDNVMVLMDPSDDPDDILRQNRSREKTFVFDYTFDSIAQQSEVYEATTKCLIESVINGYNATVFAYGATGAGKTYTMLGTDGDPGVMVRALNDLFLEMDKTSDDLIYKVSMSYLEIYNEMIRDLLNPSSGILDLREDARGGVQVAGLSEITTRSTREVMDMLTKGNKERTQEPTAANLTSSRSHAVLQVTVMQRNRIRNIMQEVRTGKLFLIDLAGSERAANTMNRGKRMVEGAHINRSLLALGNCINALSDKNGPKYINYRDSKLTRLLKDALGGNCKTVMIAHISPASIHFEESRNTLVYADRAKHIKTKVRRNVTDVAYHIAQYTNIIAELREEVMRLRDKLQDSTAMTSRQSIASIQAVQTEVLEARMNSHKEDVIRMREKLLNSFKDQMELRKSLMELNNASMEVSLETNRNQLIISSWEVEKTKMLRKREQDGPPVDNKLRDLDKATELSGGYSFQESDDVKIARDELKVLHDEKHKTEKIRSTIHKELEMAKIKTRKLEESIPFKIGSEDHREILQLLCKVHQLEMENMEVQSSCLLRDFQIKKKDMILTQYQHHRNLCDEIILQQRNVIDDNSIITPKELDELYDLYHLEKRNRIFNADDSAVTSPTTKSLSTSSFPKLTLAPEHTHGRTEEKFFTPSAKMKNLKENETNHSKENMPSSKQNNQSLNAMWRNDSYTNEKSGKMSPTFRAQSDDPHEPPYRASGYYGEHVHNPPGRHRSNSPLPRPTAVAEIINKGNRSRTVSPVDRRRSPANVSLNSFDEKSEISTNTRGIAALAAKKKSKSKSHADAMNSEKQKNVGRPLFRPTDESIKDRENYLSPSRLEKHNRIYGESSKIYVPSEDTHSYVDKRSAPVDNNLPPIRSIPEEGGLSQKDAELRRMRKNRVAEAEKQYSKKQTRKAARGYQNDDVDSMTSRRYRHSNDKDSKGTPNKPAAEYAASSRAETFVKEDPKLNALVPFDTHSYKNYHIPDTEKRRKKRKNKAQPPPTASDSSSVSTPQNPRRHFPSIPAYRKAGDITITGVGVSGHNKY